MQVQIGLPFSADLYNEFIIRKGENVDVSAWVENIVQDFMDRTKNDPNIWSAGFVDRLEALEADERVKEYGHPNRGYQWRNVILPNGTKLRMTYMGKRYFADVKHQLITYQGESFSPSELARKIANNTNRNAWRDIWILTPGSERFALADEVRRSSQQHVVLKTPEDVNAWISRFNKPE